MVISTILISRSPSQSLTMSFYSVPLPYQADAVRYYAALADLPCSAWLDSCGMARYDILSAAPHSTMRLEGGCADPFGQMRKALGEPVAAVAGIPFAGGALGYWGYDLAHSNGHGNIAAPENENRHARFPLPIPPPLAGEGEYVAARVSR